MPGHDTRNRYVFVEIFPPQCITVQLQSHRTQSFLACGAEDLEAIGWEAENPTIDQFDINRTSIGPSANPGRFDVGRSLMHDGTHRIFL